MGGEKHTSTYPSLTDLKLLNCHHHHINRELKDLWMKEKPNLPFEKELMVANTLRSVNLSLGGRVNMDDRASPYWLRVLGLRGFSKKGPLVVLLHFDGRQVFRTRKGLDLRNG